MSPDERSRTRTLDPARQARDQVRAGLPVTVCPFCGGEPWSSPWPGLLCCCGDCHRSERHDLSKPFLTASPLPCTECPHRRPSGEP